MGRSIKMFFALLTIVFFIAPAHANLISTFDAGFEGWTVWDSKPDDVTNFRWESTGGNPGGFIAADDVGLNATFWFRSPISWGGDWRQYIGGTIEWDIFLYPNRPFTYYNTNELIIDTAGTGNYLTAELNIIPVMDQWTHFKIDLTRENLTVHGSLSFDEIIQNVETIFIRGEYGTTSILDAEGLDNVRVSAISLLYTPVLPCRIADTRNTSAGIIDANTQRNFRVFGSVVNQGGDPAGCSSPLGEPLAAHINMVAVNPTGKGNLQAFPVGAGTGAGLSVNYNTIDTNLANAGTVKTVTESGPDITVASNFSSAHTVIDVLGYYYPDDGFYYTPVDPCRIVDTRKTSAGIIDASTERDFRVSGPVGDQGGNPAGCPSTLGVEPKASHINMVAVDPAGKGNLQAFPVGAGAGAGLSVNYNTIDTNLANAGTVKTVTGSGPDISVASNFSSAHTVIDVLGYYSEEEDLLYTPVTPCRIVDTRKTSEGIIDANSKRDFRVFGPVGGQGGDSGGCPSPGGDPYATHINMIAVTPTGKGNLQAYPVGVGKGAGLSVNYNTIDTNLANAGTVKTVTGAGPDITVASNFSSAHTVIDVLGYYYPAP